MSSLFVNCEVSISNLLEIYYEMEETYQACPYLRIHMVQSNSIPQLEYLRSTLFAPTSYSLTFSNVCGTEKYPLRSSNCVPFRCPMSRHHLHPIHIMRTELVGPNISRVHRACDHSGVAIRVLFVRNYRTSSNPHLHSATLIWRRTPLGKQLCV